MKTAEPKIIYLQVGEDADITEFEESDFQTNAISWCWERIFDNDIEYISKQSIIGLIDDRIEHLNPYSKNETILKQVLEELKQKIQSL